MSGPPPESAEPPASPPAASTPAERDPSPPKSRSLKTLWDRLRHHKVVQWTVAYLAVAYTLLHGAEMLGGSLGWPHGWLRVFTLLLILGIPVVVTLAWYHGARGQQRVSGTEIMIIALLLAVGGAVLWRDNSTRHESEPSAAVTPTQPDTIAGQPAAPHKSIAVLPFVNMSSEGEQEYFSDGLSEELLNLLSKVPDLRVAARTSSFYFKGKDAKLADIARELQVAHLLEGSVRKSGNRVRITAQLIRASDGYHQWSETYDRTLDDIFTVQEEIAVAVVSELKVTLLGAPPKAHKTSTEAYAFFLQAQQLVRQGTGRYDEIIALYQKVLAIDPGYAPAWLWLGVNFRHQVTLGLRPRDAGMKLSRDAIEKALAIDPDYAAAHALLGWLALHHDRDLAASARHLEHALALDPTDPVVLQIGVQLNEALGRQEKSVKLWEYLVIRDPMDPDFHHALARVYLDAGRLDDATQSYRAALMLAPDTRATHALLADVLLLKGEFDAAIVEYQQEPDEALRLAGLVSVYHAMGRKRASNAALDELIESHANNAELISTVFAYRGEVDLAFEWLYKAFAAGQSLASVPANLWLKKLHNDPRWLPFLRKIGRAPEQMAAIKFELEVPTH